MPASATSRSKHFHSMCLTHIQGRDFNYFQKFLLLLVKETHRINAPVDYAAHTLLHTAILALQEDNPDSINILELLLKHPDINVNARQAQWMTPLHFSVTRGNKLATQMLLRHPLININAQDAHGETPLMKASRDRQDAIIALLLEQPTLNVHLVDKEGRSAMIDYDNQIIPSGNITHAMHALTAKIVQGPLQPPAPNQQNISPTDALESDFYLSPSFLTAWRGTITSLRNLSKQSFFGRDKFRHYIDKLLLVNPSNLIWDLYENTEGFYLTLAELESEWYPGLLHTLFEKNYPLSRFTGIKDYAAIVSYYKKIIQKNKSDETKKSICDGLMFFEYLAQQDTIKANPLFEDPDLSFYYVERKPHVKRHKELLLKETASAFTREWEWIDYADNHSSFYDQYPVTQKPLRIADDFWVPTSQLKAAFENPQRYKDKIHRLFSYNNLEVADGGYYLDLGSAFLRKILMKSQATSEYPFSRLPKERTPPNVLHEKANLHTFLEGYEFFKVAGRTVIFKDPKSNNCRAFKFQKRNEKFEALHHEYEMLRSLNADKNIKSKLPQPVSILTDIAEEDIFSLVPSCYHFNLNDVSNLNYAYVYETDSADYFNYIDSIEDSATFAESLALATHDLVYIVKEYGLALRLIPLYHDVTTSRPYFVLASVLSGTSHTVTALNPLLDDYYDFFEGRLSQGNGDIEDWQDKTDFPNVRQSGIADFADFYSVFSADCSIIDASSYKKIKDLPYRKPLLFANAIATEVFSLALLIAKRALNAYQKDKNEQHWLEAAQQIMAMIAEFSSQMMERPIDAVKAFLEMAIGSVETLKAQLEFWLVPEHYAPYMQKDTVPANLYPDFSNITIMHQKFHTIKYVASNEITLTFDEEQGFVTALGKPTLGTFSGPFPITSLISLITASTALMFSPDLQSPHYEMTSYPCTHYKDRYKASKKTSAAENAYLSHLHVDVYESIRNQALTQLKNQFGVFFDEKNIDHLFFILEKEVARFSAEPNDINKQVIARYKELCNDARIWPSKILFVLSTAFVFYYGNSDISLAEVADMDINRLEMLTSSGAYHLVSQHFIDFNQLRAMPLDILAAFLSDQVVAAISSQIIPAKSLLAIGDKINLSILTGEMALLFYKKTSVRVEDLIQLDDADPSILYDLLTPEILGFFEKNSLNIDDFLNAGHLDAMKNLLKNLNSRESEAWSDAEVAQVIQDALEESLFAAFRYRSLS